MQSNLYVMNKDLMFLSDYQFSFIEDLIPGKKSDSGRTANNRLFIEALLYMAKTGIGWRQLPKEYGKWSSVWKRFRRWCINGVFDDIRQKISDKIRSYDDSNNEILSIDSSCVKVHQDATRYIKKLQRRMPYRQDQRRK